MWLFGKKSNQQSTKPDVPPELQPFYQQDADRRLLIRRLIAILVVVIIIAAVVFGSLWLHARNNHNHLNIASSQTTQSTKHKQTTPKTQTTTPPSNQTSSSSTPSSTSNSPTTPSNIPNTGPGSDIYWIALAAAALGAVFYHIRQVRTLNLKSGKKY
jgi:uncharacterized protein HemX